MKKKVKRILLTAAVLTVLCGAVPFAVNAHVTGSTEDSILSIEEAVQEQADCILVLGAYVYPDGTLSHMLEDRVKTGIELYKQGAAPKLLFSGDHGRVNYDEVNAMKAYALAEGVPEEDIFLDHAGFSTYESIYRAEAIFEAEKVIIVTQKYHLYRALYTAEQLGLEAVGVDGALRRYAGQEKQDAREFLARNKEFLNCIVQPEPTFLGDPIPISGDGRATNG